MRLIRIDPSFAKASEGKSYALALKEAVRVLKSGGIVVYPTETAYALGCDPSNAAAVRKIFSVKDRDYSKTLAFIAASAAQARKFVRSDKNPLVGMLADAFWPGPLTLTLPKSRAWRAVRGTYAPKTGEVAVRVSSHPVAQALSRALGRPIASTSANRSGGATPYDIMAVLRGLGTLPDVVLDAGALPKTPPSTIVRAGGGVVEILREGPITEDRIHRALMRRL